MYPMTQAPASGTGLFDMEKEMKFANNGHGILILHNKGSKPSKVKVGKEAREVGANSVVVCGNLNPGEHNGRDGTLAIKCDKPDKLQISMVHK